MAISIKQLAIIAVALFLVSTVAMTADTSDAETTEDGFKVVLSDSTAILVGYEGNEDILEIPSTVTFNAKQYVVDTINNNAFSGCTAKEIVVPNSIKTISGSAFINCSNLETLIIEGSPTISSMAISYCQNLDFIDLKGTPTVASEAILSMAPTCTVRTSSDGIFDECVSTTVFNYITPSDYIVKYTTVNAPEGVSEFGFDVVKAGSSVTLPEGAVVTGYDVSMTVGSTPVDENYKSPASDITVTLTYTLKQYTVTFVADGKTVQTLTLKHGDTITAPADNPTKEQDEKNTYTFAGWDGFTAGMTATQDVTFNAKFTETPRTYTVSFVSEGVPVQTQTLAYGAVITAPAEDPVKESEQGVDYRFVGWDGFTEGMTVTGDATFTAKFDSTDHVYTIQFVSDGEVVSTLQLGYGDTITVPAEDPVKESADGVDYVFAGWDGFTEDMTVTGDMTFEAVFDEVPQDDGGDSTWIYVAVVIVVVLVVLALVVLRKHL